MFLQKIGRDGQIRTADPSHPKRVLYQAEPRPDDVQMGPCSISVQDVPSAMHAAGAQKMRDDTVLFSSLF
jgi:hypothetical protein